MRPKALLYSTDSITRQMLPSSHQSSVQSLSVRKLHRNCCNGRTKFKSVNFCNLIKA